MPVSNRNVRIFYAVISIWSVASLLMVERVSYTIFEEDGVTHLIGTWIILCLGPILPALWLWIMERSPWSRLFLIPVIVVGGFVALSAFNQSGSSYHSDSFQDVAYVAVIWSFGPCFNAWLLKGATRVDALSWKRTRSISATSVVIDHGKYLRLLDDQAASGFPSVMRVRRHFTEALPECVPAFADHGPVPGQNEMTEHLTHARKFMLEKISYELAFLCAVSFLERMCGPDFRYTKQYLSLVEQLTQIDAIPDERSFVGLSRKAVSTSDLEAVICNLEKQREKAVARNEGQELDSDVTIALAAMTLLIQEGLLQPNTKKEEFNSKFTRMIKGGMNKMRETFSRQKTDVGLKPRTADRALQ